MTRILTNLLIAFGLFLLLVATLVGFGFLVATYGEKAVLIVFFSMLTMTIIYIGVAVYRGDL